MGVLSQSGVQGGQKGSELPGAVRKVLGPTLRGDIAEMGRKDIPGRNSMCSEVVRGHCLLGNKN